MVGDIKFQQFAHGVFDLLNARVAKLEHFAAVLADEMVVLFVAMRFLVERQIFAELVPFHQITTHQEVEGVVHRGPAYAATLSFHVEIQRFCVKVVVAPVNFFEYGKALRRLAESVIFKVRSEY